MKTENGKHSKLNCALIGCGDIGQLRAAALARTSSMSLRAASDVDPARAASLVSPYGAAAESDWRRLISRDDIDIVIVSTPPSLHAEMCIRALESGKHVICEKPLARTPEECRSILEAARKANRFLATGFNYRFYPSILKTREILDSGLIGDLDHIRSYAGYSAAEHNRDWLHDRNVVGGGALRDNGIHLIDLTRYFLGEVSEVKGYATDSVWGFNCEENGFALLRGTTGKIAVLQASWTEWRGYRFQIELYGSRGLIRTRIFPMYTQVIWAKERGGRTQKKTHWFPRAHLVEHIKSYKWIGIESLTLEFEAFAKALRGSPSPVGTGLDGLRAVEIAHAVETKQESLLPA